MLHYYVYYRVDPDNTPTLETLVSSMQARLKCQTGVMGRTLKKRDDPLLWMEIYENVENPDHFEKALMREVDKFEIEIFLVPGTSRKMECFSD
ncbi:DUF4936 family protein [Sulfurirhabdus autotrophica]|uniref:Uncharacterized protein DUF4936 n=1 Tax=Sulfurirhabdus autotrophica TaxID=1706046 RepID=A0A4R3YDL0_9PROT|nr:DUF4936 family protein [Sulfurirhabdus autotrophica]TCV90207.1 uncharacterized protein DUF4936 [Sulfurirhabdus autotrophica]